jgi:hypothetical protein
MSARLFGRDLPKIGEREELPIPAPFERGQWVRISGRNGFWKICALSRDGSLLLYGGTMTQYRSAHLDKIRAATKSELKKAGLS